MARRGECDEDAPLFDVRDSRLHVSDRPGLGHDLSEEYLREEVPF
jgi:L-alanine-DL-glutamate epimerase-like enolase superfamily enzyme